jgi:hypothetical protein
VTIPLGRAFPHGSSSLPRASRRAAFALAWPCSRRGLPGRPHYCERRWSLTQADISLSRSFSLGKRLRSPRLFTLAALPRRSVSVARSGRFTWRFPVPGVTRRRALWSADFPPAYGGITAMSGGHPASLGFILYPFSARKSIRGFSSSKDRRMDAVALAWRAQPRFLV